MSLPFTRDEFLDLFAVYHQQLWPVALGLWLASLWVLARVLRGRAGGAEGPGLLAVLWLWSGIAYHALLFTRINPLAWLFAAAFVGQGAALAWRAFRAAAPRRPARGWRRVVGVGFCGYALAYPALPLLAGHAWPATPGFGLPCPTVLLTAGLQLLDPAAKGRALLVVPLLWSLVGGSAAFLLGMLPDLTLFGAGAVFVAMALGDGPESASLGGSN